MTVAGLDHSRADGQSQTQSAWIIQAILSVGQITVRVIDRRQFLRRVRWLQMLCQGIDYLFQSASFKPFLLSPAPLVGGPPSATGGGPGQIFAPMKVVTQECPLGAKDLCSL